MDHLDCVYLFYSLLIHILSCICLISNLFRFKKCFILFLVLVIIIIIIVIIVKGKSHHHMYESLKITNKSCGDMSAMTKWPKYFAVDFCLKSYLLQKKCVLCSSLPELRFRAHGCKVELKICILSWLTGDAQSSGLLFSKEYLIKFVQHWG